MNKNESNSAERSLQELRRSSTKQYAVFVTVFCLCFVFFFTSNFWMPLLLPKNLGEISSVGDVKALTEQATLTLREWVYDTESRQMELSFDASESDVVTGEYTVEASAKLDDAVRTLDVKSIGGFENIYYVVVDDVPGISDTVSVKIAKSVSEEKTNSVTFTCEVSKTQRETIADKTEIDYHVAAIDSVLENVKSQIDAQNQIIAAAQEKYQNLETEIQMLEDAKEFQTQVEQQETESQQSSLRGQQNAALDEVANASQTIAGLREKESVMQKKRRAVMNGEL